MRPFKPLKLEQINFLPQVFPRWVKLVWFQFICKQCCDESVQERPREDEQRAGDGPEWQKGAEHVEEQQQQDGPVAGEHTQAQPWLPPPRRRRALLPFRSGVRFSQVMTTQAAQEVRTWAERVHVTSELWEQKNVNIKVEINDWFDLQLSDASTPGLD